MKAMILFIITISLPGCGLYFNSLDKYHSDTYWFHDQRLNYLYKIHFTADGRYVMDLTKLNENKDFKKVCSGTVTTYNKLKVLNGECSNISFPQKDFKLKINKRNIEIVAGQHLEGTILYSINIDIPYFPTGDEKKIDTLINGKKYSYSINSGEQFGNMEKNQPHGDWYDKKTSMQGKYRNGFKDGYWISDDKRIKYKFKSGLLKLEDRKE